MFPNRVLVCCVVVFVCWCSPGTADENPPPNPLALLGLKDAPKKPAVIPVSKSLALDAVMKTLRKQFPAGTVIVPLPDEHALLVYVTEAEAKEIRQLANPPLEKVPAPKPMVPPAPFFGPSVDPHMLLPKKID